MINSHNSIHDTQKTKTAQTPIETTIERSPNQLRKQISPSSGNKVYLYGDITYTGTLIHPIERTTPPRWTVKLDRGGYEAVNIQHITITESSQDRSLLESTNNEDRAELEIPFSDAPYAKRYPLGETRPKHRPSLKTEVKTTEELEQKIRILENTVSQLEAEREASIEQYRRLQQENENLKKDLDRAKQVIRRAKDASPVMRLSLKRVMRLAHHACMDVQRDRRESFRIPLAGGY